MIILPLSRDTTTPDELGYVRFVASTPHAQGFGLVMPESEWRFLEQPDRIEFVVSAQRLSVDRHNTVREYRERR